MNDKLMEIQEMLLNQMRRLDDNKLMSNSSQNEIARGNSLSQNAVTFLKSINVGLRIMEFSKKYELEINKLSKELGVQNAK